MSKESAFDSLSVPKNNKLLLSLDGGGIRGIMTLQLLKKLEAIAGMPCYELFDMVAGTSTGGIIAGLISFGKTATEIEELYTKLVKKVFTSRHWTSNKYANPPEYTKEQYRTLLKELLGNITLVDACKKTKLDLMITSKDVVAGEETFFTCFSKDGKWSGTYKDVLLRSVLEATMSAPTYFTPLERFVDGGITTHNNPVTAAIIEAINYGPSGKYQMENLTVFSFGTGCRPQFVKPDQVTNPDGPDVAFWLQWMMTEAGDDASDMQSYLLRSKTIFPNLDYRRFQVSLDQDALNKLPNVELDDIDEVRADWTRDLTDEELSGIKLDNVKYFPVMKAIGEAFVQYIETNQTPPFGSDLIDKNGIELLVSRYGDKERIKKQMSSPKWIDNFEF